jgi:hypothetical protein
MKLSTPNNASEATNRVIEVVAAAEINKEPVRGPSIMAGRWHYLFACIAAVAILAGSLIVQRQVLLSRETSALAFDPSHASQLPPNDAQDIVFHELDDVNGRRKTMVRASDKADTDAVAAVASVGSPKNRETQACPRGYAAGKGSSRIRAAVACGTILDFSGCGLGCGRSHDGAYYSRYLKVWLIKCYCGYAGLYHS